MMNLLGIPRFLRDGVPMTLVRAKGVALLLYLAVTRSAQPRERVLDLLWPESLPQAARKNMRNTLWAIGEALGDEVLQQDGATLRLAPSVTIDVHALEDGLLLLESGAVAALEAAADHYHGPLAEGLIVHEAPEFEIWLATERERMAALYLRLLERIIMLHQAAGDWQSVIAYAQHALAADPLREPLQLAVIEAHVRLGRRAQAVQQYAALTDILRRELDVAPLPETITRYEALLADASHTAPPRPAPPPRRRESPVPFVGRQAELAALDDERARAASGMARVVLITGDLGMGKSQLWHTWVATRATDAVVLATHALETSEPIPFGPLLTLFRQPGPARSILKPPSTLAPIWVAELARLLPEIAAAWPGLPPPLALSPAEERARLFQALTEAMRPLAQPLLLLVIDDLHWADPSTLDWLVHLVDHLRDAPLLLIGTYRSQDAPERLTTMAAGWQRKGQLRQLPLAPLAVGEGHALLDGLGAPGAGDTHAHLVQQSGGNPYFLIELSRTPTGVPPGDLASLIRARVRATVPEQAHQVLQAAAVLGNGGGLDILRATSGRTEEETLDALDALVGAGVLAEQDGAYHFVHPLVGAIVIHDLTGARQAFLHRRAAQALERSSAHHSERMAGSLIEHYAAAGDLPRAAHYADLAATQALTIGAFVEATAYARRALQWEPTPQRQLMLGQALVTGGSPRAAQAQLEAALHSFEQAGDAVGTTRACIALAMMAIGASQPDVARTWLARAPLDRAQTIDPALGAQAHLLAAGVERQSQAYDAAAAQLDHTTQLAQAHQLSVLESQIAFERGNLLADRGDRQAAISAFEEALRLAHASASPVQAALARNNLAYHTILAGDVAAAQAHIRAAVELTEGYALHFLQQYVQSTAGEIALELGELDAAELALARAYEAASEWDNRVHMANVRVNQARLAQVRNDNNQARKLLIEARDLFGTAVDPFVRDKIARVSAALA